MQIHFTGKPQKCLVTVLQQSRYSGSVEGGFSLRVRYLHRFPYSSSISI